MVRLTRLIATLLVLGLPCQAAAAASDHPNELIVEKGKRQLHLVRDGKPYKTFAIALGFTPDGRKGCEGDGKTPEGNYRIDARNSASGYHLSLHISYPSTDDRARAFADGCAPGGDIMIHGSPNWAPEWLLSVYRIFKPDWTRGCIAVSNAQIDDLLALVNTNTRIRILP